MDCTGVRDPWDGKDPVREIKEESIVDLLRFLPLAYLGVGYQR